MTQILMAVYNGEKYLSCQIESILAQTDTDWHLYICDDCSSDSSFAIAESYARKFGDRITAVRNDAPTGSACANFMNMLRGCDAEYILFSDQDDQWLPDKIKLTREKMTAMEKKYGDIPLLVHGELEIADEALGQLSPSFTAFQGLDPKCRSLNRLLCQNNVTGCTMMINRRLKDIICMAEASDMLMHDWWAALCASAFGQIGFV
ncbi:MAG: glycosyltransferase family 2 protein, partial [Huintestinicola sp.]